MKYDETQQKFLLAALPNPQQIRGGHIEKVFIGDPDEGSIFIL